LWERNAALWIFSLREKLFVNFKDKAVSGIYWNGLAQFAQELIGLLTTLILARLLSPDAFGLLGMVIVFLGFIAIFQNLGLGPSIVQDGEISQEQLSSIFWLNSILSIILVLLTIISAPLVSSFYNEPSATSIMIVLALNFPLSALAVVPDAMLKKHMMFKKLGIIQNIATVLGSVVGIITAFMGFGVWALVWQGLIRNFARTILQWIVMPWSPTWNLSYHKIKRHLYFGINLQVGSLLNYCARNVDDLLIGKVIGSSTLGVYQMAYSLMLWPLQKVSRVVGEVMFPALSTIQGNKEHVKRVFLRVTGYIAFITFPMVLGILVIAPSVVYALLGERWVGVIPIFKVLCILGLTQSIATNTGWIFLSQGRTDIRLRLQIAFSTLFIISFFIGIRWGAIGVAACYTIASLLVTPIQFQIAGKLINMTFLDIAKATSGIFICSIIMSILVLGLGQVLSQYHHHWTNLIVQVPSGIAFYITLVHIFKLRAYVEIKELFWEHWGNYFQKAKSYD
jgi:PST family polysaccharide transporter